MGNSGRENERTSEKSSCVAIRTMRRCMPSFPEDSDISYLLQCYFYPSVAEGVVKLLTEPLRKERLFGISPIDIPDPDLWREHLNKRIQDKPEDTVSLAGWITLNQLKREIEQIRENKSDTVYDLSEPIDNGVL